MNCSLLPVLFHTSSFSILFLSLLILLCFFCQLCYVRRISKLETWTGAGKTHLQLLNDSCRVLGSLTGMQKLSRSAGQQRENLAWRQSDILCRAFPVHLAFCGLVCCSAHPAHEHTDLYASFQEKIPAQTGRLWALRSKYQTGARVERIHKHLWLRSHLNQGGYI